MKISFHKNIFLLLLILLVGMLPLHANVLKDAPGGQAPVQGAMGRTVHDQFSAIHQLNANLDVYPDRLLISEAEPEEADHPINNTSRDRDLRYHGISSMLIYVLTGQLPFASDQNILQEQSFSILGGRKRYIRFEAFRI